MARSNKTVSEAAVKGSKAVAPAAPAKVGKLDKAAKAAPAKAEKAEKAEKGPAAPRGQYAGKKITVTDAGKKAALRGNRAIRFELIAAAKNINDVLGQKFQRTDGEEGTITSSGIRNFVDRGLITLS